MAFITKVENLFIDSCSKGDIDIIKLLDKEYFIDMYAYNRGFTLSIISSHLVVAKWLVDKVPGIQHNITHYSDIYPAFACLSNVKWLVEIYSDLEYIFYMSCKAGNIIVIKWLLYNYPDIDLDIIIEKCFKNACEKGRLNIAELLLSFVPEFDPYAVMDNIIISCSAIGYLDVIIWLTNKYNYNISAEKAFRCACQKGQKKVAKWLLQTYPEIEINSINTKIFSQICAYGDLEMVQWFTKLSDSLDPNEGFYSACEHGKNIIAKWLINNYHNIDINGNDDHPFRKACEYGYLDTAQWLTTISSTINIHAKFDYSFRHSCINGHKNVVEWLISNYPDIDVHSCDEYAFRYTCQYGNLVLAEWLTDHYPDINIHINNEYALRLSGACGQHHVMVWLLETFPDIDIHVYDDYIFQICCCKGNIELVKWLINKYPDIDIHSNNEEAFRLSCEYGHMEIIEYLADLGVGQNNNTGFLISCENGHYIIVKWFIQQGQVINTIQTGFQLACANGHLQIAQLIYTLYPVDNNIALDLRADEENAFHMACINGHLNIAKWLTETCQMSTYNSAFRWACRNNLIQMAVWLHDFFPDLDISDNKHYAYRWACHSRHIVIINWLIKISKIKRFNTVTYWAYYYHNYNSYIINASEIPGYTDYICRGVPIACHGDYQETEIKNILNILKTKKSARS
jgi:ankyrin repeat protein